MKDDPSGIRTSSNGSTYNIYDYTSDEKSEIIWAVAFGTLAGIFPFNWLYVKHGARFTFLFAGLLSVTTTILIPTAAYSNFYLLLAIRFIQGIAYSADFAVIGIICLKWAPLDENAIFVSVLTVFSPIATSITDSVSGVLCASSLGWKWSFYFHAIAGIVFFALWIVVYTDSPTTHRHVGNKENMKIQQDKTPAHFQTKRDIPYFKLMTNPAILCCWFNAFMDLSMSIMLITYSPTYFNTILHFPVEQTGYIISITQFAQIPFKAVAALISDRVTFISVRAKMLIFNTISCGIVAVLFACVGFVPESDRWVAMILVTLVNCLMSTNCGGYYQCARHVAQQYSDVVIAAIQFCKAIALFFVPGLIALIVRDETSRGQWAFAFCVNAALLLVANFTAYFLFSDKPADFTKVYENNDKTKTETDDEKTLHL